MANVYKGMVISTGNAVLRNAPVGTVVEVVKKNGATTLEVVDVPKPEFNTGDRIKTKHGAGTVVRLSSRFGSLYGYNSNSDLLYVSDSEPVVRRISKSDAQAL